MKQRASRRSCTRGAWISSAPAAVVTVRGSAIAVADHQRMPDVVAMVRVLDDVLLVAALKAEVDELRPNRL